MVRKKMKEFLYDFKFLFVFPFWILGFCYLFNIKSDAQILFTGLWFLQSSYILQAAIDHYLQSNFPKNWYVRHFCWWGKLHYDEEAWSENHKLIWK